MPSDPANYNEAVNGPYAECWKESTRDEAQSLIDRDVFDWVDPPEGVNPIPTKLIYKWTYNQDGLPIRPKSRVVVQGFYEADTGANKAAPVAFMESVHPLIAFAVQHGLILKQADIKTAFLHARTPADAAPIYVIPPNGFECSSEQARQVWLLKAWLTVFVSPRRDGMAHFMCIC